MPRQARGKSESGYYHVMLRGNEQRKVFLDNYDRKKYLDLLAKQVFSGNIAISGYCLMDNHIHLIVRENENGLSKPMHSIGTAYVYYFNKKHRRVGHLFQNRFNSEAISDDLYLFSALRYVHQNPVKAGMCKEVEAYPWSSDCYYRNSTLESFVSTEILSYISNDRGKAVSEYCRLMKIPETNTFLEVKELPIKPENLTLLLEKEIKKYGLKDVLDKKYRSQLKEIIHKLCEDYCVSMNDIASELGISKSTVYRILNNKV